MSLREEHYRVHPVLHYDVSSAEVVPLVVEPRDSGPGVMVRRGCGCGSLGALQSHASR